MQFFLLGWLDSAGIGDRLFDRFDLVYEQT